MLRRWRGGGGKMLEDTVDEAVRASFFGGHEIVAIGILFNLIESLPGVFEHQFVHASLGANDFLRVNFELHGRSLHPGQRLMDHDPAVRQSKSLPLGSRREQHGTHAGTLAKTVCGDVTTDELHRVVDRHPRSDRSAGTVDVHVDVGFAVFKLKVQQLSDDTVGNIVVDRAAEKDDSISQKTTVDVHRPLFAAILFDDVGNE